MKKLLFAAVAILFYQILPLLGAPALILHWKMLAIILTAATLWLSQPALRSNDAEAHRKADRRTVYLILVMAGLSTVVPELEWAYWRHDQAGRAVWNVAGLALMGGGTAFRLWAIRSLGRYFTATVQTNEAQTLITSGPYRRLRHPSYLGAYAAIVGCAVLLQGWAGLLVAAAAMGYAYARRIAAEERALSAHFGEAYQRYRSQTWRLVPGIW